MQLKMLYTRTGIVNVYIFIRGIVISRLSSCNTSMNYPGHLYYNYIICALMTMQTAKSHIVPRYAR